LKIAILMHGLAGTVNKYGTGQNIDLSLSHDHFVKNIVNANPNDQVDVFMHSWSTESEEILRGLYDPKGALFEKQIHFDFRYIVGNPNLPMNDGKTENGVFHGIENIRFHSLFSRWYSAKIVNTLRKSADVDYDMVMLTRFDLAYVVPIDFSQLAADKLYVIPPLSHHGIQDLFFISGPAHVDTICSMFDHVKDIDVFPRWGVHSHFLARALVANTIGEDNIQFIGPERPWDQGAIGAKMGPAPLVRDLYDVHEVEKNSQNSHGWVNEVKTGVLESSPKYSEMEKK